jgi:hypothetical protein
VDRGLVSSGRATSAKTNEPEKYQTGFSDDEIPYTDSGYASATKDLSNVLTNYCEPSSTIHNKLDNEDGQTIYSVASSVAPAEAHSYISNLACNIFDKLGIRAGSKNIPTVYKLFPELLKAFAVKIGSERSSQINRDIMYFIDKRHR